MKRAYLTGISMAVAFSFITTSSAEEVIEVSGRIYTSYLYDLSENAGDFNEFNLERLYLNFKKKLSERIRTHVTTDIYRTSNGRFDLCVKYAFLQFDNVYPGGNLRVGQLPLPWLGFVESIWKYRVVSKTIADLEHKLTSSDLGLGLSGSLAKGVVGYAVSFVNGEGYTAPEVDKYKTGHARLTWSPLINQDGFFKKFRLSGGGTYEEDMQRINGLLSLENRYGMVGIEYLMSRDNSVGGTGYSVFGFLNLPYRLAILGRLDSFDPDIDIKLDSHSLLICGLGWEFYKKSFVTIDYQLTSYETVIPDTKKVFAHLKVDF